VLRRIICIACLLAGVSCATYYQANHNFNQEFEQGNLDKALETLQANNAEGRGKKEFLYFVNNGLVLSMTGRYEESNEYFEKAFLFGEDYRINYLNEAASYLTNPNFTTYKGEDHEHLMLLYYKAINFLKMGKTDEALVECRRLNIRLQQLTDRYRSEDKYQRDAFVHTLMGIIYEVDRDYNNAFIAYRNAVEIYENDYERLFHVSAPRQLKEDLLRTAVLSGMPGEFESCKNRLHMEDYVFRPTTGGELIYFWHDGLSPVKAEWGVSFAVSHSNNFVFFTNRELGFTFPFSLENYSEQDRKGLSNLEFFRVVFPKYIERPAYYTTATLEVNDATYNLELLEDVNKIAFKCLQERMGLEFSKALIRVALKKSMEYSLKKEDRTMGAVLGLINAATEKADTRNWQTLPHSIYYSRVPLPEGTSTITLHVKGNGKPEASYSTLCEDVKKGQMRFHTFSSLETDYPNDGY
jgi:hypothetical protein